MKPEEYTNLDHVENAHWYYRGKREIAEYWIRKFVPLTPSTVLVDVGAGTGAFAQQMAAHSTVLAVDSFPQSLAILRDRLGKEQILEGSLPCLPLSDKSADVVTALDVIEHVEDDFGAVNEIWRILKPGGLAVITVPALMALWSDWDVALLHFRRYEKKQLLGLVQRTGVQVLHANFMNFFAFPAVWAARKFRNISGRSGMRAEDRIPPKPLNEVLRRLFVWSSTRSALRWPLGVGLLCVARKCKEGSSVP